MSTRSLLFITLLLPTFVGCGEEDVSSTDDATDFMPSEGPSEDLVEVAEDVWAPADQADLFAVVIDERELAAAEGREPQSDLDVIAHELDMSREEVAASYNYLFCTGTLSATDPNSKTSWTRCTGSDRDTCAATLSASLVYRQSIRTGAVVTDSATVGIKLDSATTTGYRRMTMLSVLGHASLNTASSCTAEASGHWYGITSVSDDGSCTTSAAGINPYAGSITVSTDSLEFIYYKTTGNATAHQSASETVPLVCSYTM